MASKEVENQITEFLDRPRIPKKKKKGISQTDKEIGNEINSSVIEINNGIMNNDVEKEENSGGQVGDNDDVKKEENGGGKDNENFGAGDDSNYKETSQLPDNDKMDLGDFRASIEKHIEQLQNKY